MPVEHSSGAVIFKREAGNILYLLLHYEEGHWGFAKGHIEKGETIEETARREIREETGITDIRFINGFKEHHQYFFYTKEGKVFKTVVLLLAETGTKEITLSLEHTGYEWLPFTEALHKITFKDEQQILQKAHRIVSGEGNRT